MKMLYLRPVFFLVLFSLNSLQAQNYLMDGTPINDCGGFFLDSGGGNNPYGPNENFTTTICSNGIGGTHVQLVFSGVELGEGDALCFYDGPDATAPQLACAGEFEDGSPFIIQATAANPGGCLTVVFTSDGSSEGPGWSAEINCIAACQNIYAKLITTDPAIEPADSGYIDICPGDAVYFEGAGEYPQNGIVYNHSDFTSTFAWDFGDGTQGIGPIASHIYTEPGGYTVQLTITDQFGCENINFIGQRVRVAPRPNFVEGASLPGQICAGDSVSLNAVINVVDTTATLSTISDTTSFQTEQARSDSLALPDGTGAAYVTSLHFTEFSPGQVLTDISQLTGICVNMEHSWMRDLEISLTCPNGTTVILHNFAGQLGGSVFLGEPNENDEGAPVPIPGVGYDYCWTPDATAGTWLEYANANNPGTLPPGDYNSYEPLDNFVGCPLNGEWSISVQDLWAIDNGFIFSWSIGFAPEVYPNIEAFAPSLVNWGWQNHPSIYFGTQDSIAASPQNAGVALYTYEVEDEFGCVWGYDFDIAVLPYTHPDCYNCTDNLTPEPDTVICLGESVDLDVSTSVELTTEVTFESHPQYAFGNANHPPATPYADVMNINSINPPMITDVFTDIVSVCIDIETDFLADVVVYLQAPDGSLLELTSNNGGGSDFYTQTCFTPTATVPITSGVSPFTGNYLPEGDWTVLNGAPINGNWALLVSDAFGPTAYGTLNSWSITFHSTNDIQYTWSPDTDLSCSDCPNPTAQPGQTTSYVVQSTDSYSCQHSDTVNIEVFSSYAAQGIVCDANGTGAMTISWDLLDAGASYFININGMGWELPNVSDTSHLITGLLPEEEVSFQLVPNITGALVCPVDTVAAVCVNAPCGFLVDTIVTSPVDYCSGLCTGSLEVSVVGGFGPFSFQLMNLDGSYDVTQADTLFAGLCGGDYLLITTDGGGCRDSLTFSFPVAEPLAIEIQQLQEVSCYGANDGQVMAQVTGGIPPYTYLWNDPLMQFFPTASMLAAGTYEVLVTDAVGCQISGQITIGQPEELTVLLHVQDVLCLGENSGSIVPLVQGGTPAYSFQWNDANTSTDSVLNMISVGSYSVLVTDANGCTSSASAVVNEPASEVGVVVAQTVVACAGSGASEAEAQATGGVGGYTYVWSDAQQTQVAVNLTQGVHTVTVYDANGCEAQGQVNIQELAPVEVTTIFVPPTCYGYSDGAAAVNSVSGGTGSGILSYVWSTTPVQTTDVATGLPGNATYYVTVTDDQGCEGTASVFLPDPPPVSMEVEVQEVNCYGDSSGVATVVALQDTVGPVTYVWSSNTGLQTGYQAVNLPAGSYSVTVQDARGCEAEETVFISQSPPFSVQFQQLDNPCFGYDEGAASVQVSGGQPPYTYTWSNGMNTAEITNLPAGYYYLTITDALDCSYIDTVEILQPEPIDPLVTAVRPRCHGEENGSLLVEPQGGTPPFSYSLDGEFFSGANSFIGLGAGYYNVFIRDAKGCEWLTGAELEDPELFYLVMLPDTVVTLFYGEEADLFAYAENEQGPVSYFWYEPYEGTLSCLDCNDPTVHTDNSLTYLLNAVDSIGCRAEIKVRVYVVKNNPILVPSAFSPNGDKVNDLLLVHGRPGTTVLRFRIFDRWGELLYEAGGFEVNTATIGWDGTFRGTPMSSGVFIWEVDALLPDGRQETFKGHTTLLR